MKYRNKLVGDIESYFLIKKHRTWIKVVDWLPTQLVLDQSVHCYLPLLTQNYLHYDSQGRKFLLI